MNNKSNKGTSTETIKKLNGFEDVYEDYIVNEENKEINRMKNEKNRAGEQHELLSFLEQENDRLTALEIFLTKKVALITDFPQAEKLIKIQIERKIILKEKLLIEIKAMNSTFQRNISHFFNTHFS